MTINEMRELVRLLRKYQDDLLSLDDDNKSMVKQKGYVCTIHNGVRGQYEHARLIVRKLDKVVNENIMTSR